GGVAGAPLRSASKGHCRGGRHGTAAGHEAPAAQIGGIAGPGRPPCRFLDRGGERQAHIPHHNSPTMAVAVVPVALMRWMRNGRMVPAAMPERVTSAPDCMTMARAPAPPT